MLHNEKDGFAPAEENVKEVVVNKIGSESTEEIFEEYEDDFAEEDYDNSDDFNFEEESENDEFDEDNFDMTDDDLENLEGDEQ